MKKAIWERNGHTLKNLEEGGKRQVMRGGRDGKTPSINAAKRESRRLQMELDKGLGRGSVRLAR